MPIPKTIQKTVIIFTSTCAVMLQPTMPSRKTRHDCVEFGDKRHNRKRTSESPSLACRASSLLSIPSNRLSLHREKATGDLAWKLARFAHVLNSRLRPFLAKWHPIMESYEASRPQVVSPCYHENAWPHARDVRNELESLRHDIFEYANLLGRAS